MYSLGLFEELWENEASLADQWLALAVLGTLRGFPVAFDVDVEMIGGVGGLPVVAGVVDEDQSLLDYPLKVYFVLFRYLRLPLVKIALSLLEPIYSVLVDLVQLLGRVAQLSVHNLTFDPARSPLEFLRNHIKRLVQHFVSVKFS